MSNDYHVCNPLTLQVLSGHQRYDDVMEDYVDGSIYKHHPLFLVDPTALQIMLYYDDVEVVNPLGSKTKKHKLGIISCNQKFNYSHAMVPH